MKGIKIKDTPVSWRVFYKSMRAAYTQKHNEWSNELDKLEKESDELYNGIKINYENHKQNYHLNLYSYKEFVDNNYVDGELYKVTRATYSKFRNDVNAIGCLQDLLKYAGLQKNIYNLNKNIYLARKLLDIKMYDYAEILRLYFNEVHKRLIIEGEGYRISPEIGWVCINRFRLNKVKNNNLDFAATRENRKRLIAEGKTLYKKEDAEKCAEQGVEYDGVAYKVFQSKEYAYEFVILPCDLTQNRDLEIKYSNYWGTDIRDKTGDELIAMCNGDISKICELKLGLNQKLRLCNQVNPILYTKFIRNENQKSISNIKANWKDRQ